MASTVPTLMKEHADRDAQNKFSEILEAGRKSKRVTNEDIDPKNYEIPGQYRHNGIVFGSFTPLDHIEAIKQLDLIDSDVIVASYPKTGTTITQEMIYLIRHDGDVDKANKEFNYMRIPYLDNAFPPHTNGLTLFNQLEHPRHLKTHLPWEFIPDKVTTDSIKCVYVLRNPKDALVSYYYFYKSVASFGKFTGSWSDFFEMFLHDNLCYGNILDHYLGWWKHRNDRNVLVLKYEDLVQKPKTQIERICRFLEKEISSEVVDKICEATRFKNMKANPSTNWTTIPEDIDCSISPFMRKGQIGDWKNHFTVAQNDLFDQIIQSKLKGSDLDFDYDGTIEQVSQKRKQ